MVDNDRESPKNEGFFASSGNEETRNIRWIISILFVVFAVINGWHVVSLLLLVAAFLVIPIKAPEYLLSKIKPMTALIVVLAVLLVGLVVEPVVYDLLDDSSSSDLVDKPSGAGSGGNSSGGSDSGNNQVLGGMTNKDEGNKDDESGADSSNDSSDNDSNNDSSAENNKNPDGEGTYILNTDSKKFHDPDCYIVDRMDEENKEIYVGSREDLIKDEYTPCGHCDP